MKKNMTAKKFAVEEDINTCKEYMFEREKKWKEEIAGKVRVPRWKMQRREREGILKVTEKVVALDLGWKDNRKYGKKTLFQF